MSRLIELLTNVQRELQTRVRTIVPATIAAYNPATITASVQPAPSMLTRAGQERKLTPIAGAPVAFPAGGGFAITWALLPGDPVLLLCSDRAIDRWRASGIPYKPDSARKHSLTDVFVWPGTGPAPDPVTGASATDLVIHGPSGPMLRITPAGVMTLAEPGVGVARIGDTVAPSAGMTTWMSQVAGFINAATPGTVAPPAVAAIGAINSGSTRVLAG